MEIIVSHRILEERKNKKVNLCKEMIAKMKETSVDIRALPNSKAKNQLLNSLEKIEGVKHAAIDSSGEHVKVTYRSPASEQQIEHCIYGAGNNIR